MQQTMRQRYINAIEQNNLVGELSFQNKPDKFLKIEMPKEELGLSA